MTLELVRKRILLVDDDRIITATLKEGLEQYGLVVQTANDAPAAKSVADEEQFDLVVIDTKMPGESGIALAQWFNQHHSRTPYIFLSAYGDEQYVEEAVLAGAMTYIVKPVQVSQLVPVIYSALERAQQITDLGSETEKLKAALETNRDINVAIGVLMHRFGLTRNEAFESLRRRCRDEQIRIHDEAARVIASEETISRAGRQAGRRPGLK